MYVALIRQISARTVASPEAGSAKTFGLPEAVVAFFLISLMLVNVVASVSAPSIALSARDLSINLILTVVVVLILVGFLELRRFDIDVSAGLSKLGAGRAIGTGALLLCAAYPLILATDGITRRFLGGDSSKQNIVELFNGSHTIEQRVLIIVLAVAVAPMAEEFVFRFFIYGVLRRYIGRSLLSSLTRYCLGPRISLLRAALRPGCLLYDRLRMEWLNSRIDDHAFAF